MVRLIRLLGFLILIAGSAVAQGGPPRHGHGGEPDHPGGFFEIKEKLNLTPEQQAKMKELRQGSGMFEGQKELMSEREKLRELMKNQNSNESEILTQAEKINQMQSEASLKRIKNMLAFRKILTPEQFKILNEHMDKKHEEFKGKFRDRMKDRMGDKKPFAQNDRRLHDKPE